MAVESHGVRSQSEKSTKEAIMSIQPHSCDDMLERSSVYTTPLL